VPLFDVVANCITIRGSFVGTRQDMAEALAFAADGKVKADIELQPLSSINNVFERLEHGDVPSRVVLDFLDTAAKGARKTDAAKARARPVLHAVHA
jgi:propanol-preferring alcohol dehydrogenase